YLVGVEKENGELVPDANSCAMCKKLIINAGIEKVVIRNTPEKYSVMYVQDWIEGDDSLMDVKGY
ncbi:hypothetical protein, partial [Treponema sp. R6D11]